MIASWYPSISVFAGILMPLLADIIVFQCSQVSKCHSKLVSMYFSVRRYPNAIASWYHSISVFAGILMSLLAGIIVFQCSQVS